MTLAVVIARTRNSVYVIDAAGGCVERLEVTGGFASMAVAELTSARPLSEADVLASEENLIRGPMGQALVQMPETAWRPVVGRTMVIRARDGARIVTSPVVSVSAGLARAA